ncbi:MAG: dipeptidase [Acidobacteria bacterium]|nr:dipeptidase [Acidobacteriota bacterium]
MFRYVLTLLACASLLGAQKKTYTDAEALQIHNSLLLIDTHNDVTSETVKGLDLSKPGKATHTDIPRLKRGNVGATFFAVYVAAAYAKKQQAAHRTLEMIDTVKRDIAARFPNDFVFAGTADQIVAARKQGKMAALMGIEGGHAIEDSLRLLRTYHDLGIRYMTLTHSNNNSWADSSGSQPEHHGLTAFGRQVVAEMNRLGMLVDISHVSDKTFWDVLEVSKAPPFASHSSCRAISDIARNMSDEMIQALAKKGGVIQINFGCEFLNPKSAESSELGRLPPAARPKTKVRATLADIVEHIDHVVKIAGVDYVGIGSDFDGVTCVPVGLEDVSQFPNLTKALLNKGYSAGDIGKIYSGNLLRVMRAAERAAKP